MSVFFWLLVSKPRWFRRQVSLNKKRQETPSCPVRGRWVKVWIKCFEALPIIWQRSNQKSKRQSQKKRMGPPQIHSSYWCHILYLILYPFLRIPTISSHFNFSGTTPIGAPHLRCAVPSGGRVLRSCRKTIWGWQGQYRYPALNILRGVRDQQYQLDLVNDCWFSFCHWYFS